MRVSVIIPTYNRYSLLQRAIQSLLDQSYKAEEIIVIDDGSTDETGTIQKDFPDVRYVYQANQGVSSARNLGIEIARSEWIAFLDSDDAWHKDKLQLQVDFHRQNPKSLISYTDEIWIRDGKELHIPKKFQKIGEDAFVENLSYCNMAPSSTLIHSKLLQEIGVFDTALEVCEDYDLWLRIALHHEIALVDKKLLYKYAGHGDQLSFSYWGMDRFRVVTLEKLLPVATQARRELIQKELLQKYRLLLKGAIKYDKIADIELYTRKIFDITTQ